MSRGSAFGAVSSNMLMIGGLVLAVVVVVVYLMMSGGSSSPTSIPLVEDDPSVSAPSAVESTPTVRDSGKLQGATSSQTLTLKDGSTLSIDGNGDVFVNGQKLPNTSGIIQVIETDKLYVAVNIYNDVFTSYSITNPGWKKAPNTSGVKSITQGKNGVFIAETTGGDVYKTSDILDPRWEFVGKL
jgi:hypothetical protein